MKKLLLICLLAIAQQGLSQNTVKVSGITYRTAYHQGGVQLPDEYKMALPYSMKMYVVAFVDSTQVPQVVDSLQSNAKGYYEIQLPPGKYGIVSLADLGNLNPGQTTPHSHFSSTDMYNMTSIYWTFSQTMPLLVVSENRINLDIYYYNVSTCGMCP